MIKNRTGLQSCKHNNLLLEEEIDFCIRKGFKVFEILFDGFWPWDIKSPLRQRIKEISQQKDLTLQVHGPIERREPWEEVLKETLEFTSEIGSKLITLHPQMKDIDIYGNIFSLAEEEGIFIGLENYKEGQIIHSPSDMEKICHFFSDYSNMGITFDPGHANLLTHPVTYLKSL
ncbi:MAG TPA: sugar phosphate isomerase/epimerase, partial [Candidatus Eremiobacteraeota bacterium]|nr:sugar phosphate isomerase/epimerase [Candidatus Eremiobacteraeota bacterium]